MTTVPPHGLDIYGRKTRDDTFERLSGRPRLDVVRALYRTGRTVRRVTASTLRTLLRT